MILHTYSIDHRAVATMLIDQISWIQTTHFVKIINLVCEPEHTCIVTMWGYNIPPIPSPRYISNIYTPALSGFPFFKVSSLAAPSEVSSIWGCGREIPQLFQSYTPSAAWCYRYAPLQ